MDFSWLFDLLNDNNAYCGLCNKFCSGICSESLRRCCIIMCRNQFNSFVFEFDNLKCVMHIVPIQRIRRMY